MSEMMTQHKHTYTHDSVYGMVIGASLGDAISLPLMLTNQYTGKLEHPVKKYPAGQTSHITSMNMSLLNRITEGGKDYDNTKVIEDYIKIVNNEHNIDENPLYTKVFGECETIANYETRMKYCENELYNYQTTEALTRSYLFALFPNKNAITNCKITNPSENCIETLLLYLAGIRISFGKVSKDELFRRCINKTKIPWLRRRLQNAYNGVIDISKDSFWIGNTFFMAFYALFRFPTFETGLEWVILQNGYKTANASVAGALLGAYYGYEHIEKSHSENIKILLKCKNPLTPMKNIDKKVHKLLEILNDD